MEYIVANHKFVVEGVERQYLAPYAPFETLNSSKPALFTAKFSKGEAEEVVGELVGDFEEEETSTKVYLSAEGVVVQSFLAGSAKPYMTIYSTRDFVTSNIVVSTTTHYEMGVGNGLMMLFAFASAPYSTLLLHSSVVVYKNKGYLFLGKSGTGKSTHSRMWLENIEGTRLLNDDNPILRLNDEGGATVFGSPWSGKTPCYRNESYEIGAIVRIWQKPENRIEKLTPLKALAALLPTASTMPSLREVQYKTQQTIQRCVEVLNIYSLGCLPNGEAAILCNESVVK